MPTRFASDALVPSAEGATPRYISLGIEVRRVICSTEERFFLLCMEKSIGKEIQLLEMSIGSSGYVDPGDQRKVPHLCGRTKEWEETYDYDGKVAPTLDTMSSSNNAPPLDIMGQKYPYMADRLIEILPL